MPQLFDRRVRIVIADQVFEGERVVNGQRLPGFRMQFKVEQTVSSILNKAEVTILNLDPGRIGHLDKGRPPMSISAGYADTDTGLIFKGTSSRVSFQRTAEGLVCKATALDGLTSSRALTNASFGKGTTLRQTLESIVGAMKIEAKQAIKLVVSGKVGQGIDVLTRGFTMSGPAGKEMDKLAKAFQFEWSFQDGDLQITPIGETTDQPALLLSAETGLIGSPQQVTEDLNGNIRAQKPGDEALDLPLALKAKSLLQSSLRPGRRVSLKSKTHTGLFRAVKVTHTGDTHGTDWSSEVDMVVVV